MSTMSEGETNVVFRTNQRLHAVPPGALRLLIDNLFGNSENDVSVAYIAANEIPQETLNQLNAFASSVARTPTKLVAIRRCSSCYIDNEPGNLAMMEDGLEQCWKC